MSNVIQDVGGYSSDVIDDVIMELVNQGGVEFVKRMKEEDAVNISALCVRSLEEKLGHFSYT